MYVSMVNSLASRVSAVHPDVETAHRRVLLNYLGFQSDQKLVDPTPFRLKQIEESRSVSFGYHKRMQSCHWILVADSKRERIGRYDTLSRQFAEDTTCLPRINPLADYSEVFVVTRLRGTI